MILILAVIGALFVPWPWSLLVVGAGILLEVGEITWGLRLARRWRPKTGREAMIGSRGVVVAPLRPNGRIRIKGELWEATSPTGADVGESVVVQRLDGLTLLVEPAAPEASSQPDDEGAEGGGFPERTYDRREADGHKQL